MQILQRQHVVWLQRGEALGRWLRIHLSGQVQIAPDRGEAIEPLPIARPRLWPLFGKRPTATCEPCSPHSH